MEVLEFVRLYWRRFVALFGIGLLLLVLLAQARAESGYTATVELVVRPPENAASAYSSDPDRYVNTQLAALEASDILEQPAQEIGLDADELRAALVAGHGTGSDIATISVTLNDPDQAVTAANASAEAFIEYLQESGAAPARERLDSLQERQDTILEELRRTNNALRTARQEFQANNPNLGVPDASSLAPAAAVRQTTLNFQLQQVLQQISQATDQADVANPSRVLNPARGAASSSALGPVAFLAAGLGLALALLVIAALSLTFSKRIVGTARWDRLMHGVPGIEAPLRCSASARRQGRDLQRIRLATTALSESGPLAVVCFPQRTKRQHRVIEELGGSDKTSESVEVFDSLEAFIGVGGRRVRGPSSESSRLILLIVDTRTAEVADAELLRSAVIERGMHVVPVLI